MGCGISRFDPRHHLHRHSPTTESIGDDDHSDINITNNGSRLLFFAYHGEDDCRRSVSSPLSQFHLKHITQMESPVIQGNVGKRKAEACSGAAGGNNPDLDRKSDAKLYIHNHNIGEEEDLEEDHDPRLSTCNNNIEDINGINGGASPLFMGSPSFREYCFVGCRGTDDDNLIKSSHIKDIGNNSSKERDETTRREGDIGASNEGSTGSSDSSSVAVAGAKKTRARRSRKGGSPSQYSHRAGAVRRSLMNVASCYHPPQHHNHNANTNCVRKLPQH